MSENNSTRVIELGNATAPGGMHMPLKRPSAPEAKELMEAAQSMEDLGPDVYRKGKQGSVLEILGEYFEEEKRTSMTACLHGLGVGLLSFTGVGTCYVLSGHHLIQDGYIGLSLNDGKPEILGPGRHVLLSPVNSDFEEIPVTRPHIQKGPLHIVNVSSHEYGLAFEQGKPLVLGPGVHVVYSAYFEFKRFVPQNDPVIRHGTVHRVIVKQGMRGLAWIGNKPLLLSEGIYHKNDALFEYKTAVKVDEDVAELGPFSIITVDDGRVGISYDKGELKVLHPGEHWINAEKNQKFLDFLPTTQQVRELKVLDVLTSDGLMVRIRGSITFSISNPQVAILNIGSESSSMMGDKRKANITEAILSTIMRRANDTLASLLTGTEVLSAGGMGFAASTVQKKEVHTQPGTVNEDPLFTGSVLEKKRGDENDSIDDQAELNTIIRHRFKSTLTKTLEQEWGVTLRDMNVIDIAVMDDRVKHALADGVRSNIVAVTDRRTAESKAETNRIIAQGERDAAKITTDGKTYAVREVARAQKEAGDLLETTPVAVEIRLAETAAQAIASSKSSMIIAPDVSTQSLMQIIGAGSKMFSARNDKAEPRVAPRKEEKPLLTDEQKQQGA